MEVNADQLLENAIRDGIRKGVTEKFGSHYDNPLDALIKASLEKHCGTLRAMLEEAIGSCVADKSFREEIQSAMRAVLARTLVQRFGGELEKQVNALKSDPTTRARIILAIEEIVRSRAS